MPAYDYCRDKVALPGSSLYYSVLFIEPGLRQALTALHAAAEEFREAVDASSDEGVARARLGWWAEEMQRTLAGQPRHPVTRVLAEPIRRTNIDAGRFPRVLNAYAEHHGSGAYRTLAELDAHCERIADLTGCMAAELCGYPEAATLEASRHLGAGLALAQVARQARRAGGHRVTDLPTDLLEDAGVQDGDLGAAHTSAALREVVSAVAERARQRLHRALTEMPQRDHARQQCRRALAEMTLANIRAMERGGYAVLEGPRAATPLRKLWIAWKHRQ